MINCDFTKDTNGLWQCKYCNWIYPLKSEKPPRRNCPKAQQQLIAKFDELLLSGNDREADTIANKLLCLEMRKAKMPCRGKRH
jgi:rubredoxin